MQHRLRRILPALTAAGIAAAAPLALAGTAQAHDVNSCDDAQISYSVDNGKSWTTDDQFGKPVQQILVKLTGDVGQGCDYPISLAAYDTQGPSWPSSGVQTLAGWATGTLNSKNSRITLDVTGSLASGCYGQIDLYNSSRKFAGADAPHYPKGVFGQDTDQPLIAHWNGGDHDCTPAPAPSQSTPAGNPSTPAGNPSTPAGNPTTPGTAQPSASTATTAPAGTTGPSTKPSASTPAGGAPTASASASPSASATPSGSTSTAAPVGSPVVKPVSTTPTKLAFTGTNGSALTEVAIGGAVLLAVGAGAIVVARRRSAGTR
ncbi:hypothetical protein [Kitasatospora viridis]|uniref:LPXTG-motif cell wall-anchored protein n=1 Tax=Kitasatospora viridis TaxID=281105 RepID=A0A561UPG3_9ACTN|nr:hypothetical protein [Kitasatospora viridis]TWG01241.1 hypothetical protein FHX73_115133 [Kitasatospora viridis]